MMEQTKFHSKGSQSALMSHDVGPSDAALLAETIGANLERITGLYPERDALVDVIQGRRWTYAQFNENVDVLARALIARGVRGGDRVGIWAPNCPEWVLLQFATAKVGAILVCVNPAYRTLELSYVLRQAGVSILFAVTENRGADYWAMIDSISTELVELAHVVYIASPGWNDFVSGGDAVSTETLRLRMSELSFDDAINIQYTSGTTGSPKGATLTHHNVLNNGFFVGELLRYNETDRICLPVPFFHCFGMVLGNLSAISHGAAIIIPSANFDAAATVRAVALERCTSLYGVPTMFIAELATPECSVLDLSSLRTGIMSGAPCPVTVMREVMERMNLRDVAICYGMTETSPVSTMTRFDDDLRRRTETVGRVMPHVEIKIVDPASGSVAPRGTHGEMCVRGYSVMQGYWCEPERTQDVIDEEGWMRTGDLAMMDERGYVSIVGRIKDMVIRGGENIYPREIEEFLYGHPDIADVAIVGVPDRKCGEEVVACIRLREGAEVITVDALRAYCEGRLARYKTPRYVWIMESFPMTISGKIRKVELREKAVAWIALQGDVSG